MLIPRMAIYVTKFQNPELYPSYHFYDFSFKNDNLDLKLKIFKFIGIQPSHYISNFSDVQKCYERHITNTDSTNMYQSKF